MIIPIKSLDNLRVDEVITDKLFDELRYGDSKRAIWVNSFGSAQAFQEACAKYVEKYGENPTISPALRMYRASDVARKRTKRKGERADEKESDKEAELVWVREIVSVEARQRVHNLKAYKRNRRYR